MKLFELIKLSIRALVANKLRSVLTMLGIIIGVSAVIALVAIVNGATASVTSQVQGLGSNLLIISPGQSNSGGVRGGFGSANSLTMADVPKVESAGSAVKAVAPTASQNVQIVYANGNTNVSAMGTTPSYADIRNVKIAQGRFISQEDVDNSARVVVVNPTVVEDLLGSADAGIIGKNIKLGNVPFLVIGVTESQTSVSTAGGGDSIYIPITTAQSRLIGNKYVRQIYVEATSADTLTEAQIQITLALQEAHKIPNGGTNDFTVTNQSEVLETMEGVTQTMALLLGGIAGISLLVGGIGVMNIMLVSVTERTREIGIRKAIGAKGRDILFQFLIESIVLSIFGGIIGIAAGWSGSILIGRLMDMTSKVSLSSVGLSFGFSALIGIVFGVFPARKAARMDPIDALRYE